MKSKTFYQPDLGYKELILCLLNTGYYNYKIKLLKFNFESSIKLPFLSFFFLDQLDKVINILNFFNNIFYYSGWVEKV